MPEDDLEGVPECALGSVLEGGSADGWTGVNVLKHEKVAESAPKAEGDFESDSGDSVHEGGDWLVWKTLPVTEAEVSFGLHVVGPKLVPVPEAQRECPVVLKDQDSGQRLQLVLRHLKDLVLSLVCHEVGSEAASVSKELQGEH